MIRLLIVDDHEMVRAGLRALLGRERDIEVAGEARSEAEAIAESDRLQPDVILMDLRLPDGSGVDACREILSRQPRTRVLFLTSYAEELAGMSTVLAGATGYLLKDIGYESLVGAIRESVRIVEETWDNDGLRVLVRGPSAAVAKLKAELAR